MNATTLKNHLLLYRLPQLWRWWIDELVGLLPRGIRAVALPGVQRLHLQISDAELVAHQEKDGESELLDHFPLSADALTPDQTLTIQQLAGRSREIILALPTDKVLLKPLTLPLVAESNLREVLGFEMDRQTPFTLDQVYYDCIPGGRDGKTNTLNVDLVVTPRHHLDDLLQLLSGIGFQPHRVSILKEDNSQHLLDNLLPEDARQVRRDSSRWLNLVLGVIALALLGGIIALPLLNKMQVIDSLEARIEVATRKSEVVQRLAAEVEKLETGADFLVSKKLESPMTLEIINELTRILPDDTWINRLTMKDGEVQLQGFASAAAALIPLIESSETFHNPRFRASVTTSRHSDSERFHLSAEVSGRARQ